MGVLTSEDDVAELLPSRGSSLGCTSTLPSAFCTLTSPSTSLPEDSTSAILPNMCHFATVKTGLAACLDITHKLVEVRYLLKYDTGQQEP